MIWFYFCYFSLTFEGHKLSQKGIWIEGFFISFIFLLWSMDENINYWKSSGYFHKYAKNRKGAFYKDPFLILCLNGALSLRIFGRKWETRSNEKVLNCCLTLDKRWPRSYIYYIYLSCKKRHIHALYICGRTTLPHFTATSSPLLWNLNPFLLYSGGRKMT